MGYIVLETKCIIREHRTNIEAWGTDSISYRRRVGQDRPKLKYIVQIVRDIGVDVCVN